MSSNEFIRPYHDRFPQRGVDPSRLGFINLPTELGVIMDAFLRKDRIISVRDYRQATSHYMFRDSNDSENLPFWHSLNPNKYDVEVLFPTLPGREFVSWEDDAMEATRTLNDLLTYSQLLMPEEPPIPDSTPYWGVARVKLRIPVAISLQSVAEHLDPPRTIVLSAILLKP